MFFLGALYPLGGPEEFGGYKGYGLMFLGLFFLDFINLWFKDILKSSCFIVEVLTGILSGSNFGPHIRKWGHSSVKEANLVS